MSAHPDVAYLVRAGDEHEELRYSLRSLANVPHGAVWIVGYAPAWIRQVRVIEVPQNATKQGNVRMNLQALAERGPDEFVLMNDDFFCMRPIGEFPALAHRGSLREQADAKSPNGSYSNMLRRTDRYLAQQGYPPALRLSHALHEPMHMQRRKLLQTLNRAGGGNMSWRSLYGVEHANGRPPYRQDAKVHGDEPIPNADWISTSDISFRTREVGRVIRRAFPVPSCHEGDWLS